MARAMSDARPAALAMSVRIACAFSGSRRPLLRSFKAVAALTCCAVSG